MKEELKLRLGQIISTDIPPGGLGRIVTVRAGDATVELPVPYGELPKGSFLTGEFILGKERLYGRFTRAQTPGGRAYPVCLEVQAAGGLGEPIKADAGSDAVKVHARVTMRVVSSFGD
jgi:serine/threonine-protein kinase